MKLAINAFVPAYELGAYEVWFSALADDGTPLLNANGEPVHNDANVSVIVSVPLNDSNEPPEGAELNAAILLAVSRFARRRILPASAMTSAKIPGIVDLVSEPAADAPPQP